VTILDETILDELDARGLVQDTTDRHALAQRLAAAPIGVYYGCDPSADSLHVGNLIGLLVLRRFQMAGHRVVALAGGATGMIGDPSGLSEERNLLDDETLTANVAAIKEQIGRIVDLDDRRAQLVDNRSWTEDLTLLEFLRDVGKHVTINQMVARESVKVRMASEQGISFTEFSYMLLQAHDYLWLNTHHDIELQIGGSDQWGNIVSGVDLIRRVRGGTVHGLSWPLLTAADGSKLGKTSGADTWLDAKRTSSYQFFQHWMRTDDRQVREFLGKFTLLPLGEIDEIVKEHDQAPEQRQAQRVLAREVTTLVHDDRAAAAAEQATHVLFGGSMDDVGSDALELVAREVPHAALPAGVSLERGVDVVDLLVTTGLVSSRSEARRSLDAGAIYVNGQRVPPDHVVTRRDLRHGRYVLLRRGKKNHAMVLEGAERDLR
jgi:tyrosyl-tRNA synthetase